VSGGTCASAVTRVFVFGRSNIHVNLASLRERFLKSSFRRPQKEQTMSQRPGFFEFFDVAAANESAAVACQQCGCNWVKSLVHLVSIRYLRFLGKLLPIVDQLKCWKAQPPQYFWKGGVVLQ
jgi:hypothetical protein